MTKYIVDLSLDGYSNEKEEKLAGIEFINESLDFSASSVSVEIYDECGWLEKEDGEEGYWDTSCGNSHLFFGGTPADNQYKFCPYCGKPIKDVNDEA